MPKVDGAGGRFLATWATFTTAVFAYLGTELVGVTVGEASNPRKVIPRDPPPRGPGDAVLSWSRSRKH